MFKSMAAGLVLIIFVSMASASESPVRTKGPRDRQGHSMFLVSLKSDLQKRPVATSVLLVAAVWLIGGFVSLSMLRTDPLKDSTVDTTHDDSGLPDLVKD